MPQIGSQVLEFVNSLQSGEFDYLHLPETCMLIDQYFNNIYTDTFLQYIVMLQVGSQVLEFVNSLQSGEFDHLQVPETCMTIDQVYTRK